jgi:hypothetical protein
MSPMAEVQPICCCHRAAKRSLNSLWYHKGKVGCPGHRHCLKEDVGRFLSAPAVWPSENYSVVSEGSETSTLNQVRDCRHNIGSNHHLDAIIGGMRGQRVVGREDVSTRDQHSRWYVRQALERGGSIRGIAYLGKAFGGGLGE